MQTLTPIEKKRILAELRRAEELIDQLPVSTPCAACLHLLRGEFCDYHEDRVPEEFRLKGCEMWEGEIPF